MRLLYLAGPYSAPTPEGVAANVAAAVAEAKKIAARFPGIFPVVPHTFSGGGDWGQSYRWWIDGTLEVMRRCDAVLMLPGWGHSKGAQEEQREAERLGKPVLLDWNDPELEAWIWQRSVHVASAFRYPSEKKSPGEPPAKALWTLLEETGDWPQGAAKPPDPKAAVEKVLRMTRTPRSAAVYRKVVERVSLQGCTDPAFAALRAALQRWFPAEGA